MKYFLFTLFILFLVILASCSKQEETPINDVTEENTNSSEYDVCRSINTSSFSQSHVTDDLPSDEDYRLLVEEASNQMSRFEFDDIHEVRWFMRLYVFYGMTGIKSDDETFIKEVKERVILEKNFISFAKEKYNVSIHSSEVKTFIDQEFDHLSPEKIPCSIFYSANALNLTIEDLLYNFDYDLSEKTLVWNELVPILREEYGSELSSNQLFEIYIEELGELPTLN